jgi:hypothetical protein
VQSGSHQVSQFQFNAVKRAKMKEGDNAMTEQRLQIVGQSLLQISTNVKTGVRSWIKAGSSIATKFESDT